MLEAPQPILLRNIIDFRIMSKAWAEKNNADQDAGLQGQGRELRLAQREWHRPLQDPRLAAGVAHPDVAQRGLVGQARATSIRSSTPRSPTRPPAWPPCCRATIDMLTDLPTQDVDRLRRTPGLKVLDGPEVRTIYLAPDIGSSELRFGSVKGKNPFADKRVRQALSMAIDREAIKRNIMRGLSIPAGVMVAPGVNGNTPRARRRDQGRRGQGAGLLKAAGYGSGFTVQMNCPNNRYVNDEQICQAVSAMWAGRRQGRSGGREHGHLHPEGAEVRHLAVPARLGRGHLRRAVHAAVAGAHAHQRCRRQLQLLQDQRPGGRQADRRDEDRVDVAKRDAMIKEALLRTRDEVLLIPLHHQMRPWAMKTNVTTIHRSDDRPEARFTSVK
jgi:peptide/nickel transport system substrate-binding protein